MDSDNEQGGSDNGRHRPAAARFRISLAWPLILVIAAVILIPPYTRWIVASEAVWIFEQPHILMQLLGSMGAESATTETPKRLSAGEIARIDSDHPGDFGEQFGAALYADRPSGQLTALRALLPRFPNQPALWAEILCLSCDREVRFDWPFPTGSAAPPMGSSEPAPSKVALAEFDRAAAAGEALEPHNAYFPIMRAIGLFAAHRDAAALAQVRLAGAATYYDDYKALGEHDLRNCYSNYTGDRSQFGIEGTAAGMLLPDLARMRSMCRVSLHSAAIQEKNGHPRRGIAIRLALINAGGLMRRDSSTLIGSVVGASLVILVVDAKPGGGDYGKKPSTMSWDRWDALRANKLSAFVRTYRGARVAGWVRAEAAEAVESHDIARAGERYAVPYAGETARLIIPWLVGMGVLVIFVCLVLAGLGSALVAAELGDRPRPRRFATALVIAAALGQVVVCTYFVSCWCSSASQLCQMFESMSTRHADLRSMVLLLFSPVVSWIAIPAAPAVCFAALAVAALITRRSFASLASAVLPWLALVFIALYALVAIATASTERSASRAFAERSKSEARYMAARMHRAWPGAEPIPTAAAAPEAKHSG